MQSVAKGAAYQTSNAEDGTFPARIRALAVGLPYALTTAVLGSTTADVFVARRWDEAQGSNSIHTETPDLPLLFGPATLPEAECSLGAVPRFAAPVRPPRPASITSSR
jgi:hypothetical protein